MSCLYIGGVLGGPETRDSPVLQAIRAASKVASELAECSVEEGSVDIVFHIPGSMIKPAHSGFRTGRFSRRESMLMVQIAVPEEQVFTESADEYVLSALREAVRIAASKFEKEKVDFSLEEQLALIEAIRQRLCEVGREDGAPSGTRD